MFWAKPLFAAKNLVGFDCLIACAALGVQEAEEFLQGFGIRGIPEKSPLALHVHETDLLQFFEVMRKRRRGNVELILYFAGDHATGMRSQERAHDLQARFGAKCGETVGGARDQKWIGAASHISTIAEIQKYVNVN